MRRALAIALALAVLLVLGHVSGNQPERDSVAAASAELGVAFSGRRIELDDVALHVVTAGPADGAPVVFLHGFPEFWYAWRGPMAVLARAGYRAIAPDQRGYNLSDKPSGAAPYRVDVLVDDVVSLIGKLGYESVFLVGQDLGGAVAWRTVLEHPQLVRRFVVVDAVHPHAGLDFESEEETSSWHRTFLQLPFVPGFSARIADWRLLTGNLRATSLPDTFPEPVMDQYRSAWDRDGAIHSMGAWYRAESVPFEGNPRVAVPTLVIVAPDDIFIPSDLSRRSLQFLKAGELRELETGGHWVSQSRPEQIGQLVREFLARESRAASN